MTQSVDTLIIAAHVATVVPRQLLADHAVAIYRQLPDARLLIAPNCPHQVMVYQPALFNQAAANFYRSTENVARKRAEHGATVAAGAAALNPVASHSDESAEEAQAAEPFSNW